MAPKQETRIPFDDWQLFQQCGEEQENTEAARVLGVRIRRPFTREAKYPEIRIHQKPHKFVEVRQSRIVRILKNGEIDHDRQHKTEVHGHLEDIPEIPKSDPEKVPYGKSIHTKTILKPVA